MVAGRRAALVRVPLLPARRELHPLPTTGLAGLLVACDMHGLRRGPNGRAVGLELSWVEFLHSDREGRESVCCAQSADDQFLVLPGAAVDVRGDQFSRDGWITGKLDRSLLTAFAR